MLSGLDDVGSANGLFIFIENHWNIASVAMIFSMYVNYMLYDCDVGEIAGRAQR
jgi:hypothetical protein